MKRHGKTRIPRIDTVIGHGTGLVGDLHFEGSIHIDGRVQGKVVGAEEARSTLVLSDRGSIHGDVRVVNAVINGRIDGDVHVSGHVELAPHARIHGSLHYHLMEMAPGAMVNGRLYREHPEGVRMLAYEADADLERSPAPETRQGVTEE